MCELGQDVFASGGRFVNNGTTAVTDSLLGLVMSNPSVGLLDFGRVVVCRDYPAADIVKVISGGPSGHEPAHAGYVGKGMLTAAVQGDVFSSPSLTDILKAIREISHKQDAGVLVIVQNSTADRLNFGLAVERARSLAVSVKMLVVSEECSAADELRGRRGLTGIILVNKIAGAMAESGRTLEDTFELCQKVQDNMTSILLSLRSCTSPALQSCICVQRMGDNEMEVGAGLHGEVGLERFQQTSVAETCHMLISKMVESFVLDSATPIVVLINNLGNTLQMEELIFVKEFVTHLQEREISVARVYHGHFMTALDMRGFSVTLLRVFDRMILDYLNAPCEALAWSGTNTRDLPVDLHQRLSSRVKDVKRPTSRGLLLTEGQANIIFLAVQFACDALISCEKQINTIDGEGGRGNMGSKIKRGACTILNEMKKKTLGFYHPRIFFQSLSIVTERVVSGTVGFLYSILFEAAGNYFGQLSKTHNVDAYTWSDCLCEASEVLRSYGSVEFGCGTMYDPLYACSSTMKEAIKTDTGALEALGLAVEAAEEAVKQTRQHSRKYPDPGAHVVGLWLRAVYEGIKMRCG